MTAPLGAGTDPEGAITAFIDDLQALLDKWRSVPRITLADLPDVREALSYAIRFCDDAAGCGVPGAAARAAKYRELKHRLDGEA